ncbi:MAG: hypothetical protein AAFQ63_02000 [Cyanobacteria bacterium J06621_11]
MIRYDEQQSKKQQQMWKTQWKQQEQSAMELLKKPEIYPGLASRPFSRRLLFYHYPAFSSYKSWALFQLEHHYWVRRVVWNRGCFLPAIGPSMPIVGCERICSSEVAAAIFASFEALLSQPFVPLNEIGIDGEIFGVTLDDQTTADQITADQITADQTLDDRTTLSTVKSTVQSTESQFTVQWWSCSLESCKEISQVWHEAISRLEEILPSQSNYFG